MSAFPGMAAAVAAIRAGDVAQLERLLAAKPELLRTRMSDFGELGRAQSSEYFRNPKLFWFIANNPRLVESMPPNICDLARVMIERGVDRADLDYALELVMSGSAAREASLQDSLMQTLLAAGAAPTAEAIVVTAGHAELDALRILLAGGHPLTGAMAAALNSQDALRAFVATADEQDIAVAFALAVINGHLASTRIALDAGADVNASLAVHAHSTALHQAAFANRVDLIDLLLVYGARIDARDRLWDGTPLDWAIHGGGVAAQQALTRKPRRV